MLFGMLPAICLCFTPSVPSDRMRPNAFKTVQRAIGPSSHRASASMLPVEQCKSHVGEKWRVYGGTRGKPRFRLDILWRRNKTMAGQGRRKVKLGQNPEFFLRLSGKNLNSFYKSRPRDRQSVLDDAARRILASLGISENLKNRVI